MGTSLVLVQASMRLLGPDIIVECIVSCAEQVSSRVCVERKPHDDAHSRGPIQFDVVREFFPTLKKCWDKGSMVVCSETIRIPHVAILPNSGADAWRYQAPFVWNYWWGSPMICHCKPGRSNGIGCG